MSWTTPNAAKAADENAKRLAIRRHRATSASSTFTRLASFSLSGGIAGDVMRESPVSGTGHRPWPVVGIQPVNVRERPGMRRPGLILVPLALAVLAPAIIMSTFGCASRGLEGGASTGQVDDPASWLAPGPLVDSDHPAVLGLARSIVAGAPDDRAAAVRIHDHVRDAIAFGFPQDFYELRASEVLEGGIGFCNNKSTLFAALCRAAGIPARLRFVQLSACVLHGLIAPPGQHVDHSWVEVWIEGRWIATDSYVVDRALHAEARRHLAREGRRSGFGVHAAGSTAWDGRSSAFVQAVPELLDEPDWDRGIHADVVAFYRDVRPTHDHKTWPAALFARMAFSGANARIAAIREGRD